MITQERAAELVSAAAKTERNAGYDLFSHFADVFNIQRERAKLDRFAKECGYDVFEPAEDFVEFYHEPSDSWLNYHEAEELVEVA